MPGIGILAFYAAFALFGLAFVLIGVWKVVVGLWAYRDDLDTVADAARGGPVSLEGTARPHEETLTASVTDRECLGYKVSRNTGDRSGNVYTRSVPFLLECDGGTVLVRAPEAEVDVLDDHESERMGQTDEWALLPGETVYVSGFSRPPAGADVAVPRDASAAIGPPPEASGVLDRIRRSLSPLSFYVADAPPSVTFERNVKRGIALILFGVALPGIVVVAARLMM